MIGFKSKVRAAFSAVKRDITTMRRNLFDNIVAISGEHAKLLARIQELEQKVEELETKQLDEKFNTYSAQAQY